MNEVTEKDRHLGTGVGAGSVHGLSQSGEKGFAPESTRTAYAATREHERHLSPAHQPTGGSETLRCASAVGPARAPSDRMEGGPTGTTDLSGGGGRGLRRRRATGGVSAGRPRSTGTCLLRPFAGSILSDSGSRRLLSFGGSDCCPQFSQGSGCENLLYWGRNK